MFVGGANALDGAGGIAYFDGIVDLEHRALDDTRFGCGTALYDSCRFADGALHVLEIEFDRRSLFEYRAFRIGALHGETPGSTLRSSAPRIPGTRP